MKGSDTAVGDQFGTAVAIFGNNVVVGAYAHLSQIGRAYIFGT
jgi:hypothetical protein